MRFVATSIALLACQAPALAQDSSVRMLGKDWVGADGNQRNAQISLQLDWSREPSAELVRRLEINWRDFPYQKGSFPVPVGEEDKRAALRVVLDIDDAGVPRACRVTKPSGEAAFDGHACPHLLRHLRFHPALTRAGKRTGGELGINVNYSAGRVRMHMMGGTVPSQWRPRPRPLKPIDAAAIGFSANDGLPVDVGGTSGALRVETDGRVSACTLAAPTQVDKFDLAICERLRAWPFEPAVDKAGKVVAADYSFGVSRR